MNSAISTRVKLFSFISSLCLILSAQPAFSQIFVTNSNDEGPGSLREAINLANANIGPDLIHFNIPGTTDQIISVGQTSGAALPTLTDAGTIIDGSTQNGYGQGNDQSPKIILEGSAINWDSPINALFINADECEIYALEIRKFPDDGIDVLNAENVIIGGAGRGNVIYSNGWDIDFFPGANPPNSGPWEGCGIVIREGSTNCIVSYNTIGTDENSTENLGNEYCGVIIRSANDNVISSSNKIIGNATGVRIDNGINNIISQNSFICNDTASIILVNNGNNNLPSPTIASATTSSISGSASSNGLVEIYLNKAISICQEAVCQGSSYLGQAQINAGVWTLNAPYDNGIELSGDEIVTALVIDESGNTSSFSSCMIVTGEECAGPDGILVVTNTNDIGEGSLREAIECANASPGPNTITFEIDGEGPHVIPVGQDAELPLPALIDDETILDATTQPGFGIDENYAPQIILDGQFFEWTAPHNAVWVQGDSCEVYGLEIRNFPDDAIDVTIGDYAKIGDVNKGNVIYSNGYELDFFPDAPNTGPWNGCGIVLKSNAENCEVKGNYIGTNYDQTLIAGNEYCGIIIQNGGDDNIIGGDEPGEENIIANNEIAIRIALGSDRCEIKKNEVYCNYFQGILLSSNTNGGIQPPVIESADIDFIAGTAIGDGEVDLYLNDTITCDGAPCQGRYFLGTAIVTGGIWQLNAPFADGILLESGDLIGGIFTSENNSSEYSECFAIPLPCSNAAVNLASLTNASCSQNNGQVEINVEGFNENIMYDIGNGPVSENIFTGLAAGAYTVVVTDGSSCSGTVDFNILNTGVPQLSFTNINNVSCGFSNGGFTVGVNGGLGPYSYDIGSGAQNQSTFSNLQIGLYTVVVTDATGCTNSASISIGMLPGPELSLSNSVNETCTNSNGSFVVNTNGGTAPYSYDIGNGPGNSPVFENLTQGTYAVTVTDAGQCTDVFEVMLTNQGELPEAEFSWAFGESSDAYNFTNLSVGATSYFWDFDDGTTSTEMNPPTHIFSADGNYTVCLTAENNCGAATFCEILSVVVPLADVTIDGVIRKENGQTVSEVEISCTSVIPQVTGADGFFDFGGLTAGADYIVEPHKNINHNNGLSVFDVFRIQQHILFFDTLDSPYKIIAADVNRNGVITVGDVTFIKQVILLNLEEFPNNESWRFVPAAYEFVDPLNPLAEVFPEVMTYDALITDAFDQDIIAIKTGDVTLDSDPSRAPIQNLNLIATPGEDADGNTIYWISASNFEQLSAFQMSLDFGASVEVEQLLPGTLFEAGAMQFNDTGDGKVALLWYDQSYSRQGQSFGANDILFGIQLNQFGDIHPNLCFDLIENAAFTPNGIKGGIDIEIRELSVSTQSVDLVDNTFYQNAPNPFDHSTLINFHLEQSTELTFRVYDVNGRLIKSLDGDFSSGPHSIELTSYDLPTKGIYFYQFETQYDSSVFKMIHQ